jgi:hypothetical protein
VLPVAAQLQERIGREGAQVVRPPVEVGLARLVNRAEHLVGLLAGRLVEERRDCLRELADLPHEDVLVDHGAERNQGAETG